MSTGIQRVIVGNGNPGGAGLHARQQALTAIAHGMEVDCYVYLYMAGDAYSQCLAAYDNLAGIEVRNWWLDAEDVESEELTEEERAQFLDVCEAFMHERSLSTGIYTGGWWWRSRMPGITRFNHLPLWNSYYDEDPDVDGVNYGGWTSSDVAIEQYQGTTDLCGQSVDLNWAKEVDMVNAAEWTAIQNLINDGVNRAVDESANNFRTFMRMYFVDGMIGDFADSQGNPIPADEDVLGIIGAIKWHGFKPDTMRDMAAAAIDFGNELKTAADELEDV